MLVRSSDWSPALRKEFFAHLEKRMKDDARVLIEWASETFTKASKEARASLLAERANALDALGKKKSADASYRKAKRLNPDYA